MANQPPGTVVMTYPGVGTQTPDGAGGYDVTPGAPVTIYGRLRRVNQKIVTVDESAAGAVTVDDHQFLLFYPTDNDGFPAIRLNMIITIPGTGSYLVKRIRAYAQSLQVDVEQNTVMA